MRGYRCCRHRCEDALQPLPRRHEAPQQRIVEADVARYAPLLRYQAMMLICLARCRRRAALVR